MNNLKKIAFKIAVGCNFTIALYLLASHEEKVKNSHGESTEVEAITFNLLRVAMIVTGVLLSMYLSADLLYKTKIIQAAKKEDESLRTSEYKTEDNKLNADASEQNKYSTFCEIIKKEDQELSIDAPQENTYSEESLATEMPKFDSDFNVTKNLLQEINVVFANSIPPQEDCTVHHL